MTDDTKPSAEAITAACQYLNGIDPASKAISDLAHLLSDFAASREAAAYARAKADIIADIEELSALRALAAAVRDFTGGHSAGCGARLAGVDPRYSCGCGYDAILRALAELSGSSMRPEGEP